MTRSPAPLAALLALLLAAPLGACSTLDGLFGDSKPKSDIGVDEPADRLLNDGLARIEDRNYEGARKKLAEIDKQYPRTDMARRALVLTTYSNYEGGKYADAVSDGTRYVGLYPNSNEAAYVQYLVGMSYINQMTDVTRDQERAEKAVAALGALVQRWPKSEYAADAKLRIAAARDQLAGKEMEIGRFYLKQRNYTGAVNRFREVLIKFQTTRHAEEALARIAEAYMALGIVNEAQTAAAVLGHNFPDGQWYKDTYVLLQTRGLEPREDRASFISRAFASVGSVVGL